MKKKQRNINKLEKGRDTITMNHFLSNYLGLYSSNCDVTHKQLKELNNSFIITLSYEFVDDNIDLIKEGKILLVRDCFNKIAPYLNPLEIHKLFEIDNIKKDLKSLKNVKFSLKDIPMIFNRVNMLEQKIKEIDEIQHILIDINKINQINNVKGDKTYAKY